MTKESTIAGPAYCAAALPVSTKMPAPMIAPMPSIVRFVALSARFSVPAPSGAASGLQRRNVLVRRHAHA